MTESTRVELVGGLCDGQLVVVPGPPPPTVPVLESPHLYDLWTRASNAFVRSETHVYVRTERVTPAGGIAYELRVMRDPVSS